MIFHLMEDNYLAGRGRGTYSVFTPRSESNCANLQLIYEVELCRTIASYTNCVAIYSIQLRGSSFSFINNILNFSQYKQLNACIYE